MSSNLRRFTAGGAISALALGSIVGLAVPANAAGMVSLAPTDGLKTGTLITQDLSLSTTISGLASSGQADQLAYKLTDTDQGQWKVIIEVDTSANIEFFGAKLGGYSEIDTEEEIDSADIVGGVVDVHVDFAEEDIYSLIIVGMTADESADHVITIEPQSAATTPTEIDDPADASGAADLAFGDGDKDITVQSWLEEGLITSGTSANLGSVDATNVSDAHTLNFYDPKGLTIIPRVERFKHSTSTVEENDEGSANIGVSLQFNKPDINLDQLENGNFEYKVSKNGSAGKTAASLVAAENVVGTSVRDALPLYYTALDAHDSENLVAGAEYVVSVRYNATGGNFFSAVGYTPPSTDAAVTALDAVLTDTANSNQTNAADTSPELRAGVNSFTWKVQIDDASGDLKRASVPVMAVVQAGDYLTEDGGYSVSGTNTRIDSASGAVVTTGFTDSNGNWSVTVTSDAADKNEQYTVDFYALQADDTYLKSSTYTASYDPTLGNTLTADSTVLSGESITAGFTVTDAFGEGTNVYGTDTLTVQLQSSDTTTVDLDAAVADNGTVSFTFDNYVSAGSSDVVTATLYNKGTVAASTFTTSTAVSLYNVDNVDEVQVPASLSTDVTYVDFIADGEKAVAGVTPAPDNGVTLTGTIVDANGVGIPGGAVTISGAGLQFKDGSKYYNDIVTTSASASGVFTVDVYSHTLNSTGQDITITSGGATATTTLKTYLPASGVDGNSLSFSMDIPENIVMNQTYAVTVSLTDKWGNPVQTEDNGSTSALSILGTGSLQINSSDTAIEKNFGKDGTTTVFLRSVKDIAGPGAVTATLQAANYNATSDATDTALSVSEISTDVTTTAWDETVFENEISTNVEVYETAADAPAATSDQKVNAGSFKGFVALYAKGYEGQRMSAIVAGKWLQVDSLASDFERVVRFTGADYDIKVRIYIDGEQVGPEFDILTK